MNHRNEFVSLFHEIFQAARRRWRCVTLTRARARAHAHSSFPSSVSSVTDRCSSLFIWSGFNNMKATARSGACCCLCGPLAVSWPLIEQREEAETPQSCRLCRDEAQWTRGNFFGSIRWSGNSKWEPPASFSRQNTGLALTFLKLLDVIWCLRSKRKQPCKWHRWLRVAFVAEKAAEGSREFLGQAHNVETLTTANMRPVSDLRTVAGDREHESNGVPLCPACFSDKTNEHTRLKDPVRACGHVWVVWGSAECKRQSLLQSHRCRN